MTSFQAHEREEDSPGYATLAAAAVSQAAYRGLEAPAVRPETDVRRAAWWRVRGLRRAAQLPLLALVLAVDGATLLVKAQDPGADVPVWIYSLPLLTVFVLGLAVVGGRRALRMAGAARRTGPRVRYTLLHSYVTEAPWLVLFADTADDEAEPLGLLPLRYGPLRDRFRELPPPVGEAVLAGGTEPGTEPGTVVVPWIDGRAYWPESGLQSFEPDNPQHLRSLSELIRPE
ncbi:hypothetical protein AB0467_05600 [Streptomyces sp. NPDC052095]|uniref:hypothetical protein n=1 Tax=unclassified Streptomyces TaxID=2593676 RepID=UPI00344BAEAD